jgi:UDP-N-acetylglucosamine--N-acetylmuramyl-(pentapeptide) pyrophosphoryl-undecaprenol N-acetylglucosamine transferase
MSSALRILLVAGGTGGHVFPALALSHYLKDQGIVCDFVTDQRGLKYLKDQKHLTPLVLPLGAKGEGIWGIGRLLFQFLKSYGVSLQVLFKFKPDVVVGFSGFPTFPTLLAALIVGKRVCIHEQNAVLGRVNRVLAFGARKILTSTKQLLRASPSMLRKIVYVGLPVREGIAALRDRPYTVPQDTFNLLIVGGSQGAQSFSEVIPQALTRLPKKMQKRLHIVHQVRPEDHATASNHYNPGPFGSLEMKPFLDDMDHQLKKAHLVIVRAGASTLAELRAAGVPGILIPYPYATDDHQFYNAQEITKQGGGWLLTHQHFTSQTLAALVQDLMEKPHKLLYASERLRSLDEKFGIKSLAQQVLTV